MESLFGPADPLNETMETTSSIPHIYTMEEITIGLAAIGALVASVVYSFRHIKSSSCLGAKCSQEVIVEAPAKTELNVREQSQV
tara:strand:+ start:881 stop:1132 length:252 start_codon:yes stop_codon:yes gene_type:complete